MNKEKVLIEDLQGEYSSLMCSENGKKLVVRNTLKNDKMYVSYIVYNFSEEEIFKDIIMALNYYNSI